MHIVYKDEIFDNKNIHRVKLYRSKIFIIIATILVLMQPKLLFMTLIMIPRITTEKTAKKYIQ